MAHLAFKHVCHQYLNVWSTKNCQQQPWKKRFLWNHHCTYPEFCQKFTLTKSSNSNMSTQTTHPSQLQIATHEHVQTIALLLLRPQKNLKWIRSPFWKRNANPHHFWVSCLVFTRKMCSQHQTLATQVAKILPATGISQPRFHQPSKDTAFHAVTWKTNAIVISNPQNLKWSANQHPMIVAWKVKGIPKQSMNSSKVVILDS